MLLSRSDIKGRRKLIMRSMLIMPPPNLFTQLSLSFLVELHESDRASSFCGTIVRPSQRSNTQNALAVTIDNPTLTDRAPKFCGRRSGSPGPSHK